MNATPATQDDIKDLHKKIEDKYSESAIKMDALIKSLHELAISINDQVSESRHQKGATDRLSREIELIKAENILRDKDLLTLSLKQSGIMWGIMKLSTIATPVMALALSLSGLVSLLKALGSI